MKRKVIQIADSTQLISLPRKWCIQNNIKKGDELNVDITEGTKVVVSCAPDVRIEHAEIKIKDYGILAPRCIYALYKKGVDELKITFEDPSEIKMIQSALKNETVGYEIVEQSSQSCMIKNISSNIMGFDSMLRRLFLILVNLAEDFSKNLSAKDLAGLNNLLSLEESNNRFTTLCRRFVNKYGAPEGQKVGPLYVILEELEKIADEYKYAINGFSKIKKNDLNGVSTSVMQKYAQTAQVIREFYDSFYKFNPEKISEIADQRKKFIEDWYANLSTTKNASEFLLLHHSLVILQKIFNLVGPLLILQIKTND